MTGRPCGPRANSPTPAPVPSITAAAVFPAALPTVSAPNSELITAPRLTGATAFATAAKPFTAPLPSAAPATAPPSMITI